MLALKQVQSYGDFQGISPLNNPPPGEVPLLAVFNYNGSMMFLRSRVFIFISALAFLLASCSSTGRVAAVFKENGSGAGQSAPAGAQADSGKKTDGSAGTISMIFAGDIMAHTVNYNSGNFDRIWQDIKPLLKTCDLGFANLEAPVNDAQDWSTYPQFNMHSSYVEAAVQAGFNVFSLANNHSNDWYLEGINATRTWFENRSDVFACGLKTSPSQKITFRLIENNGWRILFAAVTEILNRPDYASWIDYFPAKNHSLLIEELKNIQSKNKHDLFILSIHTDEAEYKKNITGSHKVFFRQLVQDCGVDVVWANHPHVYKEFETVTVQDKKAFIMYANGNTISGQRTSPSLAKKPNERDDTGDGLLIKVTFEKKDSKVSLKQIEPHFITSYIQPDRQIAVRLADEDFIHCLYRSGLFDWADYIQSRKNIYENTKGNSTWQ